MLPSSGAGGLVTVHNTEQHQHRRQHGRFSKAHVSTVRTDPGALNYCMYVFLRHMMDLPWLNT